MKTKIGIVRDHSGSMDHLVKGAMADFNLMVDSIKDSISYPNMADVTVVECGIGPYGDHRLRETSVDVNRVEKLAFYSATGGGTPLFDSVGTLISTMEAEGLHSDPTTAFLVMVITDGYENRSRTWTKDKLSAKIAQLQNTDRWTFAFRGPAGSLDQFKRIGIHEGNILEWEQTEKGIAASTTATQTGVTDYFALRSAGKTSTRTFYPSIQADKAVVKSTLVDVSKQFGQYYVHSKDDGKRIDEFCNDQLNLGQVGRPNVYAKGRAYYELTKPETLQQQKSIVVRDRTTGSMYAGANARQLLGLPLYGEIRIAPASKSGEYDIFVQSTSLNRKLVGGTTLLYSKI
jgi:hypothetical protein